MTAPLVGVSMFRGHSRETGVPYHQISEAYTRSLIEAGITPVLIPSTLSETQLRDIYERVDGIVLSGGGDMHPQTSGIAEDAPGQETLVALDTERDSIELFLTRWAHTDDKPLFGICRGHQVMNVALGGTLMADVPSVVGDAVNHQVDSSRYWRQQILHSVEVAPHSKLAAAVGAGQIAVNSIHHQAIDQLAEGLTVTATAPDGIIEGVEISDARFFVGVQWHPEELTPAHENMRRLFQYFADAMA